MSGLFCAAIARGLSSLLQHVDADHVIGAWTEPLEPRLLCSSIAAPVAIPLSAPLAARSAPALTTPFLRTAARVPGRIEAENFDRGGDGIAYNDLTPRNQGALYRRKEAVDITTAVDGSKGYAVAFTRAGEWLKYSVDVARTGRYDITFRVASRGTGGTFHLEIDRSTPTRRIRIPDTGSNQAWTTLTLARIPLSRGRHVLRLVMDSDGSSGFVGRFNWISLSVARPAPPLSLAAKPRSDAGIDLSWRDTSDDEAGFRIERKIGPDGVWQPLATLSRNSTHFVDTNLTATSRYYYRVCATNSGGDSAYAGPVDQVSSYGQPIVITTGGTYRGVWESWDPGVPAVLVQTSEPVIIEDSMIRGRGNLIESVGSNANLTVRNTVGQGLYPNVSGRQPGRFIMVDDFVNVRIENNYLDHTAGIYVYGYQGDHTDNQTVKVLYNKAREIDGRYSDGRGGYLPDPPDDHHVQFFQINAAQELHGAEIAWNEIVNTPGNSLVEDNINIFASSGTPYSPMLIHDNYIQGAYPANPARNADYTGGGIMLSDQGSSFVNAYGNQVISTSNYGIAVSSGHDNVFYNNRIISCGLLPTGQPVASQNVGAYIWNQNCEPDFTRNGGHDNLIAWAQGTGRNDAWVPDAAFWANNTSWSVVPTRATETAEWKLWQNKLALKGITVGPA